nr:ribosome rescue protein RqcH [Candidatus Sigynarchaeota archaeon]
MKQVLNNVDISVLITEIRPDITGKHIKNVYQIDDNKFLLTYRSDANKQLFIEFPNRMHLTQYTYEKPKFPPPFCVSLRKHIKDRRILDIYQVQHLDRIVVIELLDAVVGKLKLIIEFYGKGNLMLLKPDNTVLIAKRYMRLKNEQVLPNKEYTFPDQNFLDIFETSIDAFRNIFASSTDDIAKCLTVKFNINALYAEQLLIDCGIDKSLPAKELSNENALHLLDAAKMLKEKLDKCQITPQIVGKDDKFMQLESVEPFSFTKFKTLPVKSFDTFNHAVDEYFSRDLSKEGSKKKAEKKKLSKNERILNSQIEQLDNLKVSSKEFEDVGNLLYQYYMPLTKLLEIVYSVRKEGMAWEEIVAKIELGKSKGMEEALLFDSVDAGKPFINVKIGDKVIPLDIRYSLTENINKYYYDKSKKAKRKIPGAKGTIERVKKLVEQEKEEEIEKQAQQQAQKFKRRKREWFEKFRWFYSSDGYLVLGGRDAGSNEALFSKFVRPNDVFFHSEAPGAPVVIVKNKPDAPVSDIPEQTIKEATIFGVSYSRSWKLGVNAADIYSVRPEQVSKTPPSGEFLPKGSFIIRGERSHFKSVRLELAIGMKIIQGNVGEESLKRGFDASSLTDIVSDDQSDDERDAMVVYPVIIGGPVSAIKDQADFFVILKPAKDGDSAGAVASELRKMFTGKIDASIKDKIAPVDIEEIQGWLPSGISSIQPWRPDKASV